jgi:aryl-alcohol dehydrogenase-like predicted oxidoreductase
MLAVLASIGVAQAGQDSPLIASLHKLTTLSWAVPTGGPAAGDQNPYGVAGGHSEQTIGHWIAARGVRPTITTKTFHPVLPGADHGLGAARIAHRLPASLERLGVNRVELYLAHAWDRVVPVAEWTDAFEKLKEAGVIGAYGVSNVSSLELMHALSAGAPAVVQDSYSLLERGDELDVIPLCAERGVAYCAYSPLAGGWLTGKYRRGEDYPAGSRMTQRPEPYERLARSRTYDAGAGHGGARLTAR